MATTNSSKKSAKEKIKAGYRIKAETKTNNLVVFDPYKIVRFPLSTEKSIRQIEFDNKLVFVVSPQATKQDVKKAVEELFKVKVTKVNVHNSFSGQRRAYVKLSPQNLASDVSADLGLI